MIMGFGMPIITKGYGPLTFVDALCGGSAATTNQVVTKPSGVADGDVMRVMLFNTSTSQTVTTPAAGWALVTSDLSAGPGFYIYQRTASSEPASWTFVWSASGGSLAYSIIAHRGGDGVIDVLGSPLRQTSSNGSAPSITATKAGALIAFYGRTAASGTVSSPPSGMTQRGFNNTSYSNAIYELAPSSAGATGSKVLGWNTSNAVVSILMQIT